MSGADEPRTVVAERSTADEPNEPSNAPAERTGAEPSTSSTGAEPATSSTGAEPATSSTGAERAGAAGSLPARRFPVRLSAPVTLAVAAVLVVAVAAAVTFGVLLQRRVATDRAAAEALATATAYAATVSSYDYQNLDRDFADVLDGATGEFKNQYTGASQTLRQLIAGAKATAKGTVLGAGVASASPEQVQVVVFVDQAITNAAAATPRIDRNRLLMTLNPHDGRWLVSNLELR